MKPRSTARPAAGKRILLVEDELDVLDMMREILTAEGHATREAPDGRTAVALFYAEPFDIVFTDMHMPGFTGYDVAREIKKAKPSMPVVLMTGWDIESEPAELKAKGIDLLIKKPFTIGDIVKAIESLCP